MNRVDFMWPIGRYTLGWLGALTARVRYYGSDRIPQHGGVVLALNHLSWIDIPCFGVACPRNTYFLAKSEAHEMPGLGPFIRTFGSFGVRRGESDREAVRRMREVVRDGHVLGVFVEGTRQRSGVPGEAQPGAAMVALQEGVPVVPVAIYRTQFWRLGNFKPCSIAVGEPFLLEGLAKGGRGHKEGSLQIERRIRVLFDWLADLHARGRPEGEAPPTAAPVPEAVLEGPAA